MSVLATRAVVVGSLFLILVVIAAVVSGVFIGKSCAPSTPVVETGIDAGPGLIEIAEREREAVEAAELALERIETKRHEDIDALSGEQRDEYERVRAEGPDAVVRWLHAFDRQRFDRDNE